jgi:hypothetical protein
MKTLLLADAALALLTTVNLATAMGAAAETVDDNA